MDWIDILWPVSAGTALTLGLIHISIWYRQRRDLQHLVFGIAAVSVALTALIEAVVIKTVGVAHFTAMWRWGHIIYATTIISLVGYVHLRFRESRIWLLLAVVVTRLAALVLNFTTGALINFREIASLEARELLGATVMVPVGTVNPWMAVAQLSQLFFFAYLIDVMIRLWRSGDEQRRIPGLIVCGSILIFMLMGNILSVLTIIGAINFPIIINASFVGVVVVMSYELGGGVLRAASLSHALARSERQLIGSQKRLELAAEAGDLGLWEWEISKGSTWLTVRTEELAGIEPGGTLSTEGLFASAHPDDFERLRKARDEALKTGQYACDFRIIDADGGVRWLNARGRLDLPASGTTLHGVLQDFTERHRAEERFRLVVQNAPYAILIVDMRGKVSFANERAESLFGYQPSELVGMAMETLMVDGWTGFDDDEIRRADAAPVRPTEERRELHARHKEGHAVPAEVTATLVHLADGLSAIVNLADQSERQKFERETAIQRDELAHLSRISFLGEMSGSLAHELNQPLTAILSNAQAALRFMERPQPDLDEVRESLVQIIDSDKRASEIMRRVRAMMRKDATRHERIGLNEVVQESLQLLATDLLNRRVTSLFYASPSRPVVNADAVQIKQVLVNLIINACDAMPTTQSGRRVTITIVLRQHDQVEIAVSDAGVGIPSDDLERVFLPFVTSKPEGTGLGLAICRTIIEAHGGRLWASNNAGAGATVHVLLPLDKATSADANAPLSA